MLQIENKNCHSLIEIHHCLWSNWLHSKSIVGCCSAYEKEGLPSGFAPKIRSKTANLLMRLKAAKVSLILHSLMPLSLPDLISPLFCRSLKQNSFCLTTGMKNDDPLVRCRGFSRSRDRIVYSRLTCFTDFELKIRMAVLCVACVTVTI